MLHEEACVASYDVTVDVLQAVGLVGRTGGPVRNVVLSVGCFGRTERVRACPSSGLTPWAPRPSDGGLPRYGAVTFDARFLFHVVSQPQSKGERVTFRVLDVKEGWEDLDDAAPPDLLDAEGAAVVGEHEFDVEEVYRAPGQSISNVWCKLSTEGWLLCSLHVAGAAEDGRGASPRVHRNLFPSLHPPKMRPIPESLLVHINVWKAEDFVMPSVPKVVTARAAIGARDWVRTSPCLASGNKSWSQRLTLSLPRNAPSDMIEVAVHNSKRSVEGIISTLFLSMAEHIAAAETHTPPFPRWCNFYGHYSTDVAVARRKLESQGFPACAEAAHRSHFMGRVLLSFEVEPVRVVSRVPSTKYPDLPLEAWSLMLQFAATPQTVGKIVSCCRTLQQLCYGLPGVRECALSTRTAAGLLLPPPPSDTAAFVLRIDLLQGCGLEMLAQDCDLSRCGVYVEVCFGPLSTASRVVRRGEGGRYGWWEGQKDLRLELPVRAEEMPLVFLNVIQGQVTQRLDGKRRRRRIGVVTLSPGELLKDSARLRPVWHRVAPDVVEGMMWSDAGTPASPIPPPAFLQCSALLCRLDDAPPKDWYPLQHEVKPFEVRVHVWSARRLWQGAGHRIEVRCGAAVKVVKATEGMSPLTPTWYRTLAVAAELPSFDDDVADSWGARRRQDDHEWAKCVAKAERSRKLEQRELDSADALEVTVYSQDGSYGRITLSLCPAMVVRDLKEFGSSERPYSPRRGEWYTLLDQDGDPAGELLMSVDILHPDLARFHAVSSYPIHPAVQPHLLEWWLGDVALDSLPCGIPDKLPTALRASVGRHVATVDAYARAPLHAYLISPVVLVFPLPLPTDPDHDLHVVLEVLAVPHGEVLAWYNAPLRHLVSEGAPDERPGWMPVVFAEKKAAASPRAPPPAPEDSDPVLAPPLPSGLAFAGEGEPKVAGRRRLRRLGQRREETPPSTPSEPQARQGNPPARPSAPPSPQPPEDFSTQATLYPLFRSCCRSIDPATSEPNVAYVREAGTFRSRWVLRPHPTTNK
eukprot:Sspe_Gene.4263::Locus_1406_Transcript_2_2_Confidence_0.750_Length_5425::g.4263::m.4263